MAITSTGYDGVVTESPWALLSTTLGAEYTIVGEEDWRVTAKPAADRTVRIAVGSGGGHGVRDTSDSIVELQHDIVASGSRWDMIVMNRNWAGTGGASTFQIIKGGTSGTLIPGRPNNPGTNDSQPIAFVQLVAGQSQPSTIIDLRCWVSNGGATANSDLVLQYLTRAGTSILIGTDTWTRTVATSGVGAWVKESPPVGIELYNNRTAGQTSVLVGTPPAPGAASFRMIAGVAIVTTNASGDFVIVLPAGGFPGGVVTIVQSIQAGYGGFAPASAFAVGWASAQGAPTKTQFWGRVLQSNGAAYSNGVFGINFIAIGW